LSKRQKQGEGVDTQLAFRPLRPDDLPMLHEWLSRPHVREWWGDPGPLEAVTADYAPAIRGAVGQWCYIATWDDEEIGFIQSYSVVTSHAHGWWLDEHDPGVFGIDQFIADPTRLGRGLGSAMVDAFVSKLFRNSAITCIQTDPSPDNARAIRCYEKARFRAIRKVETPDGPALLMMRRR
jgi:aminoglycoside 6'-N-acetyltransferase Ib